MQFVANGPDIPDALLQAHEENCLIFFCGAGISYPAGLPGFKGLVDEIYNLVGTTRNSIEQEAYSRNQFDATLDLLERRLPGQRMAVRTALSKALQPKLRRKGATDTHVALLHLARNHEGVLRLVTTNFDLIFESAAKRSKQFINTYPAPMLPIPKNSRWDGLVYLHGVLPETADESALNRLVLTSGDFGLAYLTERWAARFVSELFRNYAVCFVGYSINDPVLRYMMDAIAADRMLGEVTPQAYALGDCEPGQENSKTIEWEAKGVVPILYEVPSGSHDHSCLHRTLKVWAETYRDGILGKERIVVDYALARPSASTRQDDFVGRMLWALSHESGLPAKRFAEFNPVPSIDWLEAFSDDRYRHSDLHRFGIQPLEKVDDKLRFSLVHRPAPYSHAGWMSLASTGAVDSRWDSVMFNLARWLVRHLNDPKLILWLAQRGGQLSDHWRWLIEGELDKFFRLEQEGKIAELEEIRANAPNSIPQPSMRILWRLLLTGRVQSSAHDLGLYRWKDRFIRYGLTATIRMELRSLLEPKIVLSRPLKWGEYDEETDVPDHLKQLVDWELVLAADNAHSSIKDMSTNHNWMNALPFLIDDFQHLLHDALDLLAELGEADDRSDRSYWDLPSISPHWQNRGFRDWVVLIELVRDAWLAIRKTDPARAARIGLAWFELPYPTFKRLALFAASQDSCITAEKWVEWLSTDDARWLWSVDTQRETMRLLVLQGAQLSAEAEQRIETFILIGPPRAMYRPDIEPERWKAFVDHSVWLLLAKLQEGGSRLSTVAMQRFKDLSEANPAWKLSSNERDEFSHWMSGTGDPDFNENRQIDVSPRKRGELVDWLKRPQPSKHPFYEDTWPETCRTRFFHCACALNDLATEGLWPAERWREALQAWSEEGLILRSWRFIAPLVQTMPDPVLKTVLHGVAWWLKAVSKSIDKYEVILLDMCRRILALSPPDGEETGQPVMKAINHPVGYVTEALLNFWFGRKPSDNDKLPADIEPFFTQLCDTQMEQFRHGRVLLASQLIALFRVDRTWTETHLLPLFDWTKRPAEAKAVWEGFLWSPRLYQPLLAAFKGQFLETACHYADLGGHGQQFAALLTYAAIDSVDTYEPEEFRDAIGALPQEGLGESARALVQALEGAGEQREEYWRNRIQPFWQRIWPKSRELASKAISETLARLSIAARGEFPSALSVVLNWLQPIEHPYYVVRLLQESEQGARFPEDSLQLLNAIIDDQPLAPEELALCLGAIADADPTLEKDSRYVRLVEYSRRRGI